MPNDIQIAEIFKPFVCQEKDNIILDAGRDAGKSKTSYIVCGLRAAQFPNEDIVIGRASYGSIETSAYSEMVEVIEDIDAFNGKFIYRKSPLRICDKNGGTNIYFIGLGGSKDRTKGIKTKHPVGMVMIEEAQELKSKEHLDQVLASLRRRFGKKCLLVVVFNPPNNEFHWINVWKKQQERDKDWQIIHSSWRDIVMFLNDRDIKEILKIQMLFPEYYRYLYEGEPSTGLGRVYPMFRPDIHVIPYNQRDHSQLLQDFRVVAVIIGCDGAVNHDKTVFVPRLIMSNGQSVAAQRFIHNPQTDGVKGSFPLVENEGKRWFSELIKANNLNNPYDYMNSIPIIFVVDSAASELVQALKYYFSDRAEVVAIKKGTILQMVDVNQSAIGKNVCAIYDYGGYYNYTLNKFVQCVDPLIEEYKSLCWNEKQNGYDPTIPNDCTDADTYGVYFYYRQTENIIWLSDVVNARKDYYILRNS